MKKKSLMFCPKCGSQKISKSFKTHTGTVVMGLPEYQCNSCGYESALFPVAKDEAELKKIQEKLKQKLKDSYRKELTKQK